MLDRETKQKIDSVRQILVGKVPDPKAQVEQITTALMYKFMDDMDMENEEVGLKAQYFINEFAKYSWRKLLDNRLSGQDRLNLYVEAIMDMSKNKYIPQIFRDIFKGAFLPFRDPRTLSLFLKGINEFTYEHSETLGNAFEYLLSILGSQGDAGQFRTPRHIIDFIVEVVDPKKTETILDPACGTAGFLISAYKHIVKTNSENYKPEKHTSETFVQGDTVAETVIGEKMVYDGKLLTPTDKKRIVENIAGYDISPDMIKISLVNMYLHNFPNPKIYEYDTLTSDKRWGDFYDVILANPPFMSPKGGISPHSRFTVKANRAEVLFVDYIAEHLNIGGRAGIIVPEGIIFQGANAYKNLRKNLIENWGLYAVVSLPSGVFQPYSGVKTSILFIDKDLAKRTDEILFVKTENDGFDLGAQRRKIDKNDLPSALESLNTWKETRNIEEGNKQVFSVKKDKIAENGDYNLTAERYREAVDYSNAKWPVVELGDVFLEIKNGKNVDQFDEIGKYKVSRIQTIADGTVNLEKTKNTNDEVNENDFLQDGDILFSHINSFEHLAKTALFGKYSEKVVHGANLIRLRPDFSKLIPKFALSIFKTNKFIENARNYAQKAVNQASINTSSIKSFKIPLPPLEVQEQIVAEIEQFQKVIDGAKQVVENWKPSFRIDPSWPMVELGEVCEVNPKKNEVKTLNQELRVSFVPMVDLSEGQMYFKIKHAKRLKDVYSGYTYFAEDDVLLARVTPCFENGKCGIAKGLDNRIGFGSSEYFVYRPIKELVLPEWVYFHISSLDFRTKGKQNMSGTGGLQRLTKEFARGYKIPLPPLEVQEQIVLEIEAEQKIIEANKELIAKMEKKIEQKIGEVWGEE